MKVGTVQRLCTCTNNRRPGQHHMKTCARSKSDAKDRKRRLAIHQSIANAGGKRLSSAKRGEAVNDCQECGMLIEEAKEYHPYAACLMFLGCRDSEKVRANLSGVVAHGAQYDSGFDDMADRIRALEQNVNDVATINVDLMKRNRQLEAALLKANADLKAVWIKTGEGLEGLKRTEVALGLTVPETPVSTLCAICDQIKELHPNTHPWTAKNRRTVT